MRLRVRAAASVATLVTLLLPNRSAAVVVDPKARRRPSQAVTGELADADVMIMLNAAEHMKANWAEQRQFVLDVTSNLQGTLEGLVDEAFDKAGREGPPGAEVHIDGGELRVATGFYNVQAEHLVHPLIPSMEVETTLETDYELLGGAQKFYSSYGALAVALRACNQTLRAVGRATDGRVQRRFCLIQAEREDICEAVAGHASTTGSPSEVDEMCVDFPEMCPDTPGGAPLVDATSDMPACQRYLRKGLLVGSGVGSEGIQVLLAVRDGREKLQNADFREFVDSATDCSLTRYEHLVETPTGEEEEVTDWLMGPHCNGLSIADDFEQLAQNASGTFAPAVWRAVGPTLSIAPPPPAPPAPGPAPAPSPAPRPAPTAPQPPLEPLPGSPPTPTPAPPPLVPLPGPLPTPTPSPAPTGGRWRLPALVSAVWLALALVLGACHCARRAANAGADVEQAQQTTLSEAALRQLEMAQQRPAASG